VLASRTLTAREIEALADVPPRDQLLARLAGGFQAPLTKAAGLFQAFTRNFAYGIKAYLDQRAEGEPVPEESRPTEAAEAAPGGGESDRSEEEAALEQDQEAAPESTTENAPAAEAATEQNEATEESGE
jgi:large subunit ribosomal protein L10